MRHVLAAALGAAVCSLSFASAASAATVAKTAPDTLTYTGAPAEVNDVTVTDTGVNLSFDEADMVSITPGTGCAGGGAAAATCNDTDITRIVVELADGDDELSTEASVTVRVEARGGDGRDDLDGSDAADLLDGGAGQDSFTGEGGADTIRGGDDGDRIGGGTGDDQLHGGDGSDVVIGGDGADTVRGEDGGDTFIPDSPGDDFSGGAGFDTLILPPSPPRRCRSP